MVKVCIIVEVDTAALPNGWSHDTLGPIGYTLACHAQGHDATLFQTRPGFRIIGNPVSSDTITETLSAPEPSPPPAMTSEQFDALEQYINDVVTYHEISSAHGRDAPRMRRAREGLDMCRDVAHAALCGEGS